MLKVTVLEISRGKVRLGFEADADIPVHRWEVWEQIRGNGRPDSPTGDGSAAPAAR
jgi:carbon storage regulator CsrA